jgi:hypothetical protein
MKTRIPSKFISRKQAEKFLQRLHENGESFHPEEDAHDIINYKGEPLFTDAEARKMNLAISRIYEFKGFDPCEFLNDLIEKSKAV